MIRDLYLLPLRASLLSLKMDAQRVYLATRRQNCTAEEMNKLKTHLEQAQHHRERSYDMVDQTRAMLSRDQRGEEVQLISQAGNTPFYVSAQHPALSAEAIAYALREEFRMRQNAEGPHFLSWHATSSLDAALFASRFLQTEAGPCDIEAEVRALQQNVSCDSFSIASVLQLPTEEAANAIIDFVGYRYCGKNRPLEKRQIMHEKLRRAFQHTLHAWDFAEAIFKKGIDVCCVEQCSYSHCGHARYGYARAYCPACLFLHLRNRGELIPHDTKTVLRDFRDGHIITGKMWFREGMGFYEAEAALQPQDLRCTTVYP